MTASSCAPTPIAASPSAALDTLTVRRLLTITRQMMVAADRDDWESVSRGDVERRAVLDGAVDPARADGAPDTLIETLRESDRALLHRARRSRDALLEHAHRVHAERGARQSYASVMAGTERAGEPT